MLEPSINQHFQRPYPCVLAIGGHDPTGGAGVLADAQAILANQAWPLTLVTALTHQNTQQLTRVIPQDAKAFDEQFDLLLSEFQPSAIKLGVLGSLELQEVIVEWLHKYPKIPVVLDPVMSSTSGGRFFSVEQLEHLQSELLPLTTLITPNHPELHQLVPGLGSDADKARALINKGCRSVLVTGTHASTHAVRNQLYLSLKASVQISRWPRLPEEYHGSGCTLAASIAALLARGEALEVASHLAQQFTWLSLNNAVQLSEGGQYLPLRLQAARQKKGRHVV